jgi:hypothetical protein
LHVGSPLVGAEAWLGGPYGVVAWLSASIQTLTALDTGADLLAHVKLYRSVDGKVVARVLPFDRYEELLFHGVTADVWMQDGVTEQNLRENMAGFYRRQDPEGELALGPICAQRTSPADRSRPGGEVVAGDGGKSLDKYR